MTNTRAGKYRHRITILNPSTNRDAAGARTGTGSTFAEVWAEKQDWTGNEVRDDGKETATVTTKYLIRYRPGVVQKMSVVHDGITYDVENVMDFDGRKRELTLFCRRVA